MYQRYVDQPVEMIREIIEEQNKYLEIIHDAQKKSNGKRQQKNYVRFMMENEDVLNQQVHKLLKKEAGKHFTDPKNNPNLKQKFNLYPQ